MSGASDLQTVAQNIAQAINAVASNSTYLNGSTNTADISVATLVKNGVGRLARVSITTAGSGNGAIYDVNSVSSTLRKIYTIPNTIGVIEVNFPMNYGIVVVPGTGQVLSVSYS